jgi:5-methylcytosine-specific restriction endonuclease McrA
MPTCAKCETEKPDTEFRVRADRNNWRLKNCKPCERVIQLENYYKAKGENPLLWRARVMRNNRSPHITIEWLEATLLDQGGVCALSGITIDLMTCEIDHIVPETRSGSNELSNLRLVCTRANEAKGNMTDDEFLELCRNVLRKLSGEQS